ncbi:bifunctional methylenetetrahydrofolate dehydrogenase/methenyltetrahydrofolate cyclohydrolase FolD [Cohaesibacter sp. CAU 1516]|uniref:bifunctional methylenetetrahydrofolate dehydrogenase/methenyltetrahydrofolate cyclohydrolase FolD n=1 Tax=Cohaesibacter sp. CAU 1516 TaxID=2576038 RepID=UPI0010FCEE53|nr:bifunctional methylenetetrahydrofolate dehydrogenase/methenyltetrahydrofolate cyclohydrolase FolD [Cohaesibacter sp. CAU 1516]TLP49252.1 bifunctional methylenetetrahydrofolate dehydrogenase/methenyltetrahydrofolate cyclohydrolase FolD [Cohaesibacter sp. CAU 1516]
MTATRIDGKAIATDLRATIAIEAEKLIKETNVVPGIAVVIVGEDPASKVYVASKGKAAKECNFHSVQHTLADDVTEEALLSLIGDLNDDPAIHGILVQLPLPDHINESKVLNLIRPDKDVDGFHPINVGLLTAGERDKAMVPCTPAGSLILAKRVLGNLSGKNAVVIGRSNIVGKPMAALLLAESCTVTIAHSRTKDLPDVVRGADIVVAAVGRPQMVKGDWIKDGACVIDVGINRIDAPERGEGKTRLVGDVDYDSAVERAGSITPVPGGVGPMTIALLMANTLTAARRSAGLDDLDYASMLS